MSFSERLLICFASNVIAWAIVLGVYWLIYGEWPHG